MERSLASFLYRSLICAQSISAIRLPTSLFPLQPSNPDQSSFFWCPCLSNDSFYAATNTRVYLILICRFPLSVGRCVVPHIHAGIVVHNTQLYKLTPKSIILLLNLHLIDKASNCKLHDCNWSIHILSRSIKAIPTLADRQAQL